MSVFINRRDRARGLTRLPDGPDEMPDHLRKAMRRTAWHERRALAPLSVGWRHRELILAVLRRELADRLSWAPFGSGWALTRPFIKRRIYTVTLTKAMRVPLATAHSTTSAYARSSVFCP